MFLSNMSYISLQWSVYLPWSILWYQLTYIIFKILTEWHNYLIWPFACESRLIEKPQLFLFCAQNNMMSSWRAKRILKYNRRKWLPLSCFTLSFDSNRFQHVSLQLCIQIKSLFNYKMQFNPNWKHPILDHIVLSLLLLQLNKMERIRRL